MKLIHEDSYVSRTVPGWASVRGLAATNAYVSVNGNEAFTVAGRVVPNAPKYYFGSDDFDNSARSGWAELETYATVNGPTNDFVSAVTNRVFVPQTPETFAYDADGNLTEDGRFRYWWNGENRMVRTEEKLPPEGRDAHVIVYAYDHQGRNVTKDGALQIWDDYNIIVENAAASNATVNAWGLDIDGTMQGAGGVGGLLAVVGNGDMSLPAYDANGNITEYVDSLGGIESHTDYSAFGRGLVRNGAQSYSHGFSTKPMHKAMCFSEYEYRKYDKMIGRWLSVDQVLDSTAYVFLDNDPISVIDLLGNYPVSFYNKYRNPTYAVRKRGRHINPRSKEEHVEYCGCVCMVTDEETCEKRYFTTQTKGVLDSCDPNNAPCPAGSIMTAGWHTHGGNDPGFDNENFSPDDKNWADAQGIDFYLITPGDNFKQYVPGYGEINRGTL